MEANLSIALLFVFVVSVALLLCLVRDESIIKRLYSAILSIAPLVFYREFIT